MKFFFDRCLSVHIARMMHNYDRENNVVHQDDDVRFTHDTDDISMIETLASESPKPCWITADLSQRTVAAERVALRDSGMTIFFFKKNNGAPHHQALKALAIWPTLVDLAESARVATAFVIPFGRIGKIGTKIDRLGNTSDLFKND